MTLLQKINKMAGKFLGREIAATALLGMLAAGCATATVPARGKEGSESPASVSDIASNFAYGYEQKYGEGKTHKVFGGDFSVYSKVLGDVVDNFAARAELDNPDREVAEYLRELAGEIKSQKPTSVTLIGDKNLGLYYMVFGDSRDSYSFLLGFDKDGKVKSISAAVNGEGLFEFSTLESTVGYAPYSFYSNKRGVAKLDIHGNLNEKIGAVETAIRNGLQAIARVNRQTPLPFGFVTQELAQGKDDYEVDAKAEPGAETIESAYLNLEVEKTRKALASEDVDEGLIVCGAYHDQTLWLKALSKAAYRYLKGRGETLAPFNLEFGQLIVSSAEGNRYYLAGAEYTNKLGKEYGVECSARIIDEAQVQQLPR